MHVNLAVGNVAHSETFCTPCDHELYTGHQQCSCTVGLDLTRPDDEDSQLPTGNRSRLDRNSQRQCERLDANG
jgi:hypothetical protein